MLIWHLSFLWDVLKSFACLYYMIIFFFFLIEVKFCKGFPGGSVAKNLPANARDAGWISGSRRSFGESESEITQSCPTLCIPMGCSLPRFSVHGISQARVLEWVAISISVLSLSWEIPWTKEPGGLQSMRSQRVRHYLATKEQQQQSFVNTVDSRSLSDMFPKVFPSL